MAIGNRIKRLRQDQGWSQLQLANKIKTHQKQISKYERGVNLPSTEVIIKLTEIFNVSADYLIFEKQNEKPQMNIADRELVQKLAEIGKLSENDKMLLKGVLDAFIIKNRFQRLAGEAENNRGKEAGTV
jgi:transcriptional regulator with XRE-family HTH domain